MAANFWFTRLEKFREESSLGHAGLLIYQQRTCLEPIGVNLKRQKQDTPQIVQVIVDPCRQSVTGLVHVNEREICRQAVRLPGWLIDWLSDWLAGWLVGLSDWLAGWLVGSSDWLAC